MARTPIVTATYEVRVATRALAGWRGSPLADPAAGDQVVKVRCSLSRRGLVVDYGGRHRIDLELPGRRLRTTDLARKEYRVTAWPRSGGLPEGAGPGVVPTGGRGRCQVDGLAAETRRWELKVAGAVVEAWSISAGVADPVAVRELWQLLVPGCPADLAGSGLPADVIARAPDDPGRLLGRVRLLSLAAGGEDACADERPGFTPAPVRPVERPPRRRPEVDAPADADAVEPPRPPGLRFRDASAPARDATWSTAQPALDQLAAIVNTVSGAFAAFTDDGFVERGGREGEMGVVLDWWPQLEPHLRDDPGGSAGDVAAGIKKLYLAFKVANGDDLVGLRGERRRAYRREVLRPRLDASTRLLRFLDLIDAGFVQPDGSLRPDSVRDQALREVAEPEWEALAAPRAVGFGLTELSADVGPGEVTRFIASNFHGTRVVLGDGPLVERLEFTPPSEAARRRGRDGAVRLVVHVAEISVDFAFETKPSGNAESILCAIFTFGLCAAAVANSGDGRLTLFDARIALDVRRKPDSLFGVVELQASVDRAASSMSLAWSLFGFNLVADWVIEFANQLGAWDDLIAGSILRALDREIRKVSLGGLLQWPAMLHVIDGPPVLPTGSSFEAGHGALHAALANDSGLLPAGLGQADADALQPMGLGVSARYLASWAREQVPAYESVVETEADLGARLGITTPDPASFDPSARELPRPEEPPARYGRRGRRDDGARVDIGDPRARLAGLVEDCEPPPQFGPSYANRLLVQRRALVVALPEDGTADHAGLLRIDYTVRFEPVRRQFTHFSRVVQQEVCHDLEAEPGGLPESVRIRYRDTIAALQVARRGLEDGMTAGRMADRLGDIAWARIDAASARAEGRTVVVDPPPGGGPGTPEVPDIPGRPGRPSLPTRVCEPPHCEWFSGVSVTPLGTYLEAAVRAEAPVEIGLNPGQGVSPWLPELTMRGQQARGQDGRLVNVVRVSHLGPVRTANGFERADPLLVASVVQELVREDAAALLASIFPTPNTGEPEDRLAPVVERTLLPPLAQFALVIPANLQRLVVFKDAAAAAARYTARSGFIHWAMQVEDHVGDVIG